MQVFIVMIESERESVFCWDVDRVFSTMDSAKAYIAARRAEYRGIYDIPEFCIEVEEVYA